jgi:transposase-like protein
MKPPKEVLKTKYYEDKMTFAEISQFFGVSKATVCKWFKSYDLKPIYTPRNKLPISKELLIEMYVNQQLSMEKIAEKLLVNRVTISKWLKYYEVEVKNPKKSSPSKEELSKHYLQDFKTLDEIAQIYDTNRNVVSRWLNEQNIEIRLYNRKVEKPTKECLIRLYVKEKLTINQIAVFYSTNRSVVTRWLQSYQISIKSNQRKFYHLRATPLNEEQKQFVIGTLLGDGHISLNKKRDKARLCLTHSIKQANYFFFKKRLMGNFINNVQVNAETKRNSVKIQCASIYNNNLVFFHKLFYNNTKKVIREDIIHYLTPFVMAIWVMDDGWKNHSNIRISSEGFSEKENEILKKAIKINFNINCKIAKYKKNNKEYCYLSFNKRNSILLTELIKDHILNFMSYKLIPRSSTTKCEDPSKTEALSTKIISWREEWSQLRKKYKARNMI